MESKAAEKAHEKQTICPLRQKALFFPTSHLFLEIVALFALDMLRVFCSLALRPPQSPWRPPWRRPPWGNLSQSISMTPMTTTS
jgi:hypothetical protein